MTDERWARPDGYPYGEFDAAKWADEFDRIFPAVLPDHGTMLGWFANAIMTGYDKAKNESVAAARERDELREQDELRIVSGPMDADKFAAVMDRHRERQLAGATHCGPMCEPDIVRLAARAAAPSVEPMVALPPADPRLIGTEYRPLVSSPAPVVPGTFSPEPAAPQFCALDDCLCECHVRAEETEA